MLAAVVYLQYQRWRMAEDARERRFWRLLSITFGVCAKSSALPISSIAVSIERTSASCSTVTGDLLGTDPVIDRRMRRIVDPNTVGTESGRTSVCERQPVGAGARSSSVRMVARAPSIVW